MTAMISTRPRAMILFDIFKANHEAKRLTIVSPGYAEKHADINGWLDELEALGWT